jgi:hypothetical protein
LYCEYTEYLGEIAEDIDAFYLAFFVYEGLCGGTD